MYRTIEYFEDLQDNRHPYYKGDTFPKEGMKVTDARLDELATTKNRRGIVLIEKVERKGGRPTKAELLERADEMGIEVPEGATNPEIAELIELKPKDKK